jgi:hypothetical protein
MYLEFEGKVEANKQKDIYIIILCKLIQNIISELKAMDPILLL